MIQICRRIISVPQTQYTGPELELQQLIWSGETRAGRWKEAHMHFREGCCHLHRSIRRSAARVCFDLSPPLSPNAMLAQTYSPSVALAGAPARNVKRRAALKCSAVAASVKPAAAEPMLS